MQTYWLEIIKGSNKSSNEESNRSLSSSLGTHSFHSVFSNHSAPAEEDARTKILSLKQSRLIDWIVGVLSSKLKQIVADRQLRADEPSQPELLQALEDEVLNRRNMSFAERTDTVDTRKIPAKDLEEECATLELGEVVTTQLHNYVRTVCALHPEHPFHNFEHASHVTMSLNKFFNHVAKPCHWYKEDGSDEGMKGLERVDDDSSFGIRSDPLTEFVAHLSSVVHRVDHPGIENAQLVKEMSPMAAAYFNQSVAEQNSLDLAWDLLMEPSYTELRRTIYTSEASFRRFRQLMVNFVVATDIMDEKLKRGRDESWALLFAETAPTGSEGLGRKAALVLQHLMQAAEVSHMMQPWPVYTKWNVRAFEERYVAFLKGRTTYPSEHWYQSELTWFDETVIPLAKKLRDCGVLGDILSHKLLMSATKNRNEWQLSGLNAVRDMLAEARAKYDRQVDVKYSDAVKESSRGEIEL